MYKKIIIISTLIAMLSCSGNQSSAPKQNEGTDTIAVSGNTEKGCDVVVAESDDKKVRIMSWDTDNGGTSPAIQSVCVYHTQDNEVLSTTQSLMGLAMNDKTYGHSVVRKIYSVHSDDKITYITELFGEESSLYKDCVLISFSINRDKLVAQPLFSVDGKPQSMYEVRYKISDSEGTFVNTDSVCIYDKKNQTFKIQQIDDDFNLVPDYITMRFNGKVFTIQSK